jgi:hypothetical protein
VPRRIASVTSLRLAFNEPLLDRAQPDPPTSARPPRASRSSCCQPAGASSWRLGLALLVPMLARRSASPCRPSTAATTTSCRTSCSPWWPGRWRCRSKQPPLRGGVEEAVEEQLTWRARSRAGCCPNACPRSAAGPGRLQPQQRRGRGDYYDLIERDDGQLVVIISDVSGGTSACWPGLQACCAPTAPSAIPRRGSTYPREHRPDPLRHAVPRLVDPVRRQVRWWRPTPDHAPGRRFPDPAGEGRPPLGAFDFGSAGETRPLNPDDGSVRPRRRGVSGTARVESAVRTPRPGADDLLWSRTPNCAPSAGATRRTTT